MRAFRLIAGLGLALLLAACGADNKYASDAEVSVANFVAEGPTSVTLFTVLRKSNGTGAHAGLLINAPQGRVMYDPAGSWYHPDVPERNDLHIGMTDKAVAFYIDYHARETFDVVEQTVQVSPQVASLIYQRAVAQGSAPKAFCTNAASSVLSGVPGFEAVRVTFMPRGLMKAFDQIPGAKKRVITDDDADKNHGVRLIQANEAVR